MNMHVINVMDSSGHTTVTWDPQVPESVTEAKREFDDLVARGYSIFRMNLVHEDGIVVEDTGQRITEFDPQLGKVIAEYTPGERTERLTAVPHQRGG